MAVSSLEEARVQSLPSSAYYIADFITEEEEQILLNKVSPQTLLRVYPADILRSQQRQSLAGNILPIDACKPGHPT